MKKRTNYGFTILELLVVMVIAGVGLLTVAPKLAENTILSDKTEVFFEDIITSHLKTASELGTQVHITGSKGSPNLILHDGSRVSIPAGEVSEAYVNDSSTSGTEYTVYFYPDGIFDQFILRFSDGRNAESYPALHKVVIR